MSESGHTYSAVWQRAITDLRREITDTEYMMWLNKISYEDSGEGRIAVCVPSKLILDQVKLRYSQMMEEKLEELAGKKIALEFVIRKNSTQDAKQEKKEPLPAAEAKKGASQHLQLNERYTFENFIIGESNNFAANAAIAIARNPGRAYNPCLIYGGVGLGKTHLIQALGNFIHKNSEDKKIIYVTAESFTSEFVSHIRNNTAPKFTNKYRSTDVLLIDDIHFLQKKEDTLEELFHTFNELYDKKKQIVFTCDRPISELKNMEDRIKSRFSQGLSVNLKSPSYETRYAIIKNKADSLSLSIPDAVINLICNNITTNVRDLEASLTTLAGYAELVNKKITLEIAQSQLRDLFSAPQQNNVTIDIIKRTVADYYGISMSDLSSKKKTKALSDPRQVAMFITREITEYALTEIGQEFGGRDHSTVNHACDKIRAKMKTDPTLEGRIQNLIQKSKENSVKA